MRFHHDGQNSMIEDLERAEAILEKALLIRSERYKMVQDMTISAHEVAGVMKGIKKLNSQINSFQNTVNRIKEEMGYHQDEILKSEKKKKTIL